MLKISFVFVVFWLVTNNISEGFGKRTKTGVKPLINKYNKVKCNVEQLLKKNPVKCNQKCVDNICSVQEKFILFLGELDKFVNKSCDLEKVVEVVGELSEGVSSLMQLMDGLEISAPYPGCLLFQSMGLEHVYLILKMNLENKTRECLEAETKETNPVEIDTVSADSGPKVTEEIIIDEVMKESIIRDSGPEPGIDTDNALPELQKRLNDTELQNVTDEVETVELEESEMSELLKVEVKETEAKPKPTSETKVLKPTLKEKIPTESSMVSEPQEIDLEKTDPDLRSLCGLDKKDSYKPYQLNGLSKEAQNLGTKPLGKLIRKLNSLIENLMHDAVCNVLKSIARTTGGMRLVNAIIPMLANDGD